MSGLLGVEVSKRYSMLEVVKAPVGYVSAERFLVRIV